MNILRELFIENSKKEFLNAVQKTYPNDIGLVEYIQNMKDIDVLYNHFDLPEPKTITEKISNLIESSKVLKTNKDYFKNSKIYYVLEDIIYEEIINIVEDIDFTKTYETVMNGLKTIYKGDIPEGVQKKIAKKIIDSKNSGHDTEKASEIIIKKFKKYAADPTHRFADKPSGASGPRPGGASGPRPGGGPNPFYRDQEFHKAWEDLFGETFADSKAKWARGERAGANRSSGFRSAGADFGSHAGSRARSAGADFASHARPGFRYTAPDMGPAFKRYAESVADYNKFVARTNQITKIIVVSFLVLYLVGITWSIYESFQSVASKSCKKKFPKNKTEYDKCVKNFKNKAKIQRINHLQKGKLLCKKTKNPKLCEQKLNQKILDVKKTMR